MGEGQLQPALAVPVIILGLPGSVPFPEIDSPDINGL